ncbi:MAG: hypothetical protein U5R31_16840 [Acidimicrobiia bacterium]|nr:hypothetical protein [Acidimicrobiia bacterium]
MGAGVGLFKVGDIGERAHHTGPAVAVTRQWRTAEDHDAFGSVGCPEAQLLFNAALLLPQLHLGGAEQRPVSGIYKVVELE